MKRYQKSFTHIKPYKNTPQRGNELGTFEYLLSGLTDWATLPYHK